MIDDFIAPLLLDGEMYKEIVKMNDNYTKLIKLKGIEIKMMAAKFSNTNTDFADIAEIIIAVNNIIGDK